MSKALGFSGSSASLNPAAIEAINYLNKVDTTAVDNTNTNLAQNGYNLSQTLSSRPDYIYTVNGSDAARQRMENSVYNSYLDKLLPQFNNQTSDLETRLQNQGLSVGSEAYQRAMNDLQNSQNDALNQAAYNSISAGQTAFSNSLNDSIATADFSNKARQQAVNEVLSLISKSPTGYEVAMDKYSIASQAYNDLYNRQRQNTADQAARLQNTINSAGQIGAAFAASDRRFKENIKPVGKLNNGLTVYLFNYKNDKTPRIGLIAQEVKKIKPDAITEDKSGFLYVRYDIAVEK